jgi:NAD(P)-dependent dehydrogenase (short-subunit alcohol dehydrogenase family)
MKNNMNLKNKVIVITGGVKGFGRSLADIFASMGAKVVVSSHSSVPESWNSNIFVFQSDVRKEEDVKKLKDFALEKFGQIDIWVNNAGIFYTYMPIEKLDMIRVHDVFETNVFGVMYGSRMAMEEMRKKGSGIIVNIISSAALSGRPTISAYSSSKFAEDGFTKALRLELEGSGVKVIAVYPGGMKTNLFDEARPEDYSEYMDPNEVAEKVVKNIESENPDLEQILKRQK